MGRKTESKMRLSRFTKEESRYRDHFSFVAQLETKGEWIGVREWRHFDPVIECAIRLLNGNSSKFAKSGLQRFPARVQFLSGLLVNFW